MKPYIKSDFVGEHGELGDATRIPPKSEGGAVTAADIVTATGTASTAQAEQIRRNLGAESSRFEVSITKRGSSYVADKTYAQILAAHQSGKLVVFCYDADVALAAFMPRTGGQDDAFVAQFTHSYPTPAITMIAVPSNDIIASAITAIEAAQKTVTVSGTTPTITPADNHIYNCGELASLTISNPPATGAYSIVFTSGATPTVTTFPASILGLEDFAPEANTVYEINVLDNRAVYKGWPLPAGE